MNKRIIFIIALLVLCFGAEAQSTSPTIYLDYGQNSEENFGEDIEQVSIYVNSEEDFWARMS